MHRLAGKFRSVDFSESVYDEVEGIRTSNVRVTENRQAEELMSARGEVI